MVTIARNDSQIYGDIYLEDESASNYSKIERFFNKQWNDTIFKLRWPIIALAFGWSAFAGYKSMQLGPLTEQE